MAINYVLSTHPSSCGLRNWKGMEDRRMIVAWMTSDSGPIPQPPPGTSDIRSSIHSVYCDRAAQVVYARTWDGELLGFESLEDFGVDLDACFESLGDG